MPVTAPTTGSPTKTSFASDVVDELALHAADIDAIVSLGVISNGSFESDTDADTVPDGWTFAAQTSGSGALDATTSAHGSKSFKMVSIGGSGNGGGDLQMSTFAECSPQVSLTFRWQTKSSVAGVKNIVAVRWYSSPDEGDYLSTTTLWSEDTANPTSDFQVFSAAATPVATAKYFKLKLTGCDSTDTTAGTAWFDDITVVPSVGTAVISDQKSAGSAGGATVSAIWTKHTLQTEVDALGLTSLASSVITLQPGRYRVHGWMVGYKTDGFKCRLRDTTNSATVFVGSDEYSAAAAAVANTKSVFSGPLNITSATNYELQYWADSANGTDGLGKSSSASSGEVAVFAQVQFEKIG